MSRLAMERQPYLAGKIEKESTGVYWRSKRSCGI